jgi:hypothetical protein
VRSLLEQLENVMTEEMEQHFIARTRRHIALTQKYCVRLEERDPNLAGLSARGLVHDASKFEAPECEPYIWLTWRYKCKDDGVPCVLPPGMEARINAATEHHILTNAHHPEAHQARRSGLLNTQDRDKPPREMVDATRMGALYIAEMVADWAAMSEERGNTARAWADQNVNVRWRFTPAQVALIDRLIDVAQA